MKKGSGIILLDQAGRILLQLRGKEQGIRFPDHWNLIGGSAKAGESPEETLKREINEELGIKIGLFRFFKKYIYEGTCEQCFFYAQLNLNPDEIKLTEGQRIAYFNRDQLGSLRLAFNAREVIDDFFAHSEENKIL